MKDLDFDELDRAVNSIMSGSKNLKKADTPAVESTPTVQVEPVVSPAPVSARGTDMPVPLPVSSAGPAAQNQETTVQTAALSESEPATNRKPPAAARRGRFMDMVRPGAAQSDNPFVPTRVTRQGATIERAGPLVTDIIPSAPQSAPKKAPPATLSAPAAPEPQEAPSVQEAEWPDPLDMLQDDAPSAPSRTAQDAAPLVSPFLSGAKVEKRPLGGVTTQEVVEPAAGADSDKQIEDRNANPQLTPNPADSASAPLPEELSSDVMALESDANTIAMPADKVKTEVARQVAAQEDSPSTQESLSPSVSDEPPVEKEISTAPVKAPVSSEPEPIIPKGPISIPQQYREEPSTGDKESGSIYDTDTYHDQPLAHPKKKKSGWLWVLWIVLILAIGAAGGAALYWLGVF